MKSTWHPIFMDMEVDEEPEPTNAKQILTISQPQGATKSSGPVTIVTPANLIVSSIAGLGNQPKVRFEIFI